MRPAGILVGCARRGNIARDLRSGGMRPGQWCCKGYARAGDLDICRVRKFEWRSDLDCAAAFATPPGVKGFTSSVELSDARCTW